ncbi:2-succinyl-5-enolpyruvyl-6-hydroxy-3-cyclohexene-1-carboxylic-acid synthase [Paraburkholderia rhizosphaerae]|uniref:2-succinyl-5-enolpyruvyl-6-hydroxy-3-cyclohexene-1-carboxylate synthase n=1 Tax=Paraburkholderia rhizosphaerae TaxID=480658 RepID=A0A4R8LJV7_9BURK|nr:2-succinyl-5-enolpyruvyl-6-hydroxy-3-cyclohexene-1-carboxylic-acid synthase [Paraburkholderia rhizosphaerae]TDY42758.1 2-succinyl-5-enolpyruvyl-6-hydroxy-3-cyclohexene-1-carboxylate synthase [Paraburkholderia rhizosphaerae]
MSGLTAELRGSTAHAETAHVPSGPKTSVASGGAAAHGPTKYAAGPSAVCNLNELWIRCILDVVAATGVRRAVLCPGGRSSTTVLAVHDHPQFIDALVFTDERSAAYAAVGMMKASREPVLMVTTSGSAVANAVPALTEADECGLPLLLLTCDRPRTLRNSGFGQMIDHVGACRAFVRASIDLPDPASDVVALAALRRDVAAVLVQCRGAKPGPVHVNVPLGGLYDASEPQPVPADALRESARPVAPLSVAPRAANDIGALAARLGLRAGMRGLVVTGPDCDVPLAWLTEFAHAARLPVLADTGSGLRGSGLDQVLNGHDALALHRAVTRERPDLVIRFGLTPVMPIVQDYLKTHPCPTIKISGAPCERDYLHSSFEPLVAPSRDELRALAAALAGGDAAWLRAWQAAEREAASARNDVLDALDWGELPAMRELYAHDGFAFLHLGNSMPIRHADLLYDTRANGQAVYANRGVWGIDGTLSTFIGEARARGDAGLLVLGDQAFLHDLPALATAQRVQTSACVCVLDNGGGAIFDFLPLARLPGYETAIRNPYSFNAADMARAFGLRHARAASRDELRAALDAACTHVGVTVLEVRVAPGSAAAGMQRVALALRAAAFKTPSHPAHP